VGRLRHPRIIASVSDERQVRRLHAGRAFDVNLLSWRGRDGRPLEKVVIRHRGAVAVLPVLDDGRLVLIRNYRVTLEGWLIEFCAGGIDAGEAAIDAARRELSEETGYRAGAIEPLTSFYTAPGFADEWMQVFVAGDLEPGDAHLEPYERIEVMALPPEEVAALIASGEIRDAKTIVAFHAWNLRGRPRPTRRGGA